MTEDEADEASMADLDAICGAVLRLAAMTLAAMTLAAAVAVGGVATWVMLALSEGMR
jgi:hypothetical protein